MEKRDKMDKKNAETTYDDWKYATFETEVCYMSIDDDRYVIPAFVGKKVKSILDDPNKNSEMVHLGDLSVRAYMIKKLYFTKGRFVELSDWGKRLLLEKEPNLFGGWRKNFSPTLKEKLNSICESSNNRITPWGLEF